MEKSRSGRSAGARLCLLTLASSACGAAPPPAAPSASRDDVAALERRIDGLESRLSAQKDTATTRFESLVQKLEELEIKLDETLRVAQARSRSAPAVPRPPRHGPDAAAVYSVPIGSSPFEGPKHAKVTLVVAMEFTEPFSKRLLPTLDALRTKYGNQLKVVYQHFVVHPQIGTPTARAVCAAGSLGRHRQMIDAVFAEYDAWRQSSPRDDALLDEPAMFALASRLGLNRKKFKRAFDGVCPRRIAGQEAALRALGVSGVPASFVNGRFVRGAQPSSNFELVIDEELDKADKAIKSGVKLRDYYGTILASGVTSASPTP